MRRFVPELFLKQLGKSSIEEVKLGDPIAMNMVVMSVDINQYLTKLGPPSQGPWRKYIGDSIMAFFPSVRNAVRYAIEMHAQPKKAGDLPEDVLCQRTAA
jgi:hypothetical protein